MSAFEEQMEADGFPSIRATRLAGWPRTGLVFALPVPSLLGPPICSLIVCSQCESLNRGPWPGAQIMTRCVLLAAEAKLLLGVELPWKWATMSVISLVSFYTQRRFALRRGNKGTLLPLLCADLQRRHYLLCAHQCERECLWRDVSLTVFLKSLLQFDRRIHGQDTYLYQPHLQFPSVWVNRHFRRCIFLEKKFPRYPFFNYWARVADPLWRIFPSPLPAADFN